MRFPEDTVSRPHNAQPRLAAARPAPQGPVSPELDDVVASVLHRLRTPLTAIKGWNELLLRWTQEAPTDEVRDYALRTRAAILDMQSAIDEIAAEGVHRSSSGTPSDQAHSVGRRLVREDVRSPIRRAPPSP